MNIKDYEVKYKNKRKKNIDRQLPTPLSPFSSGLQSQCFAHPLTQEKKTTGKVVEQGKYGDVSVRKEPRANHE
jgi:hypothetical protein